jgi:hypothetical protein
MSERIFLPPVIYGSLLLLALAGSVVGLMIDPSGFALELASGLVGFSLLVMIGGPMLGVLHRYQVRTAAEVSIQACRILSGSIRTLAKAVEDEAKQEDWRPDWERADSERLAERIADLLKEIEVDRLHRFDAGGPWRELDVDRRRLVFELGRVPASEALDMVLPLEPAARWYGSNWRRGVPWTRRSTSLTDYTSGNESGTSAP